MENHTEGAVLPNTATLGAVALMKISRHLVISRVQDDRENLLVFP